MMNLNQSFRPPLPNNLKKIVGAQLLFAFLGFLDATYLTIERFSGIALPCFTGSGCETVTRSIYSAIGPVPISLLGAGYYLVLVVLFFAGLLYAKRALFEKAWLLTWAGFFVSFVLVLLQLFVIRSICAYCMASAFFSIVIWALTLFGMKGEKMGEFGPDFSQK
jgi:uncharacterized membrane protein